MPAARPRWTAPRGLTRFSRQNFASKPAGSRPASLIVIRVEALALKGRRRRVGRLGFATLDRLAATRQEVLENFPGVDVREDIRVDVHTAAWRYPTVGRMGG